MKKVIKLGLIAFIALSFVACKGKQKTTTDTKAVADTAKKDTTKKK